MVARLSTFAADVRASVLTGLSTATATAVVATDTEIVAFGKLQAQITASASPLTAVLTGLSVATSTAVVAADTILAAFGKLQAQNTLQAPLASPTFTGTVTAGITNVGAFTATGITASPISGSTGSFTTLAASGLVSGVGFSNYLLSPPAIGTTTPAAGKFTTLAATGVTTLAALTSTGITASPISGSSGSFTTLAASGATTLAGLNFGSVAAASTTDLSKHIAIYSTNIGFSVTTSRLNYVVPVSDSHVFIVNAADIVSIANTGLSVIGMAYASTGFQTSGSGMGYVKLTPGDATFTGYVEFYNSVSVRQGYLGYASAGSVNLKVEGSTTNLAIIAATTGVSGTLNVAGYCTFAGVTSTGQIVANGATYFAYASTTGWLAYASGGHFYNQYTSGWYWDWNSAGGNLAWIGNSTNYFNIDALGVVTFGGAGSNQTGTGGLVWYGGGSTTAAAWGPIAITVMAWAGMQASGFFSTSDRRSKTEINDITDADAITWIKAGRPRTFRLNGSLRAGFIAQEDFMAGRGAALVVLDDPAPEYAESDGVVVGGKKLSRDYHYDNAYLTKALQNALTRIETLEAHHA